MKYCILLSSFVFCLISCKKKINDLTPDIKDQETSLSKITDSCSYTIDGMQFICDKPFTEGKGNAGANLDTTNNSWKWDADTMQYRIMYGFTRISNIPAPNDGQLIIYFVKKFHKSQLIIPTLGILAPATDTSLYAKGMHPYAADFDRYNTQNGVVLKVNYNTGTSTEILNTYINASPLWPSTLNNECQKDSEFEVLKVYSIANGEHIIEARFTANLFDKNERVRKLENGYLRIHVE